MPFNINICDFRPLVIDKEILVKDEELLAKYISEIILGHFVHVKKIINELSSNPATIPESSIELAIQKLKKNSKSEYDLDKRDGWVFQIITWVSLLIENKDNKYYCQQPHDAPAQHGIDGISIVIDEDHTIKNIIITEDKCTGNNQRSLIPEIWNEFSNFEKGIYDHKIVSRISVLLENINNGEILENNKNELYNKYKRIYRVGINRGDPHKNKIEKLFKGFDQCIVGDNPHRRYASTIYQSDIRGWMENLCEKSIKYLEDKKNI